jgi:queuosine precursor transporter
MIYAGIYIVALVAANLLVAWLGVWFSLVNAFVLIGLDLSLRDKLHDLWEGDKLPIKMGGLIATASIVSYAINPATGMIAFASLAAFSLSMVADAFAYQYLKGKNWLIRANGSNVAGSAVDSVVFPTIAFGGLMLEIVALQFVAKVGGGYVWSKVLEKKNVI